MHHRQIRRLCLAFVLPPLLAPLPLCAEDAGRSPDPGYGARIIAARCTFCHTPTLTIAFVKRRTRSDGVEGLDAFLSTHHAPDDGGRAAIIALFSTITGSQ